MIESERGLGQHITSVDEVSASQPVDFLVHGSDRPTLSPRQTEALFLWANGLTGPEISEIMQISLDTVENHTVKAKKRLGAPNISDAVAKGFEIGIIDINSVSAGDFEPSKLEHLTNRQREIFLAVMTSDSAAPYKEIAYELEITEQRLRNICSIIFKKLGVNGRRQARIAHLKLTSLQD